MPEQHRVDAAEHVAPPEDELARAIPPRLAIVEGGVVHEEKHLAKRPIAPSCLVVWVALELAGKDLA